MAGYTYSHVGPSSGSQSIDKKILYGGLLAVIGFVGSLLALLFLSLPPNGCRDGVTICSWSLLYTHPFNKTSETVALAISPSNRLVRPPNPSQTALFQKEMRLIGTGKDMDPLCRVFERYYDSLGLNGLISALHDAAPTYGLVEALHRGMAFVASFGDPEYAIPAASTEAMYKHLIGGWGYDKAMRLNYTERETVEVVGSLQLVGAPLHAVVWQAMSRMERNDSIWDQVVSRFCYFADESVVLFVHCLHGMGHGMLYLALPKEATDMHMMTSGMTMAQEGTCGAMVMEDVLQKATKPVLDQALKLCGLGPTVDQRYICSAGVYMSFFNADTNAELGGWRIGVCDDTRYAAPCFRFLHEHAGDRNVCQQRAYASGSRQKRGCIYGYSHKHYTNFDMSYRGDEGSLVAFCKPYFQQKNIKWDAREWLSCIAGSMATVAFTMATGNQLPVWIIHRHCEQLLAVDAMSPPFFVDGMHATTTNSSVTLGKFAQSVCDSVGASRRTSVLSDLLIWRTDILE